MNPVNAMGQIYIGGMVLRYDVSGGTTLKYGDGTLLVITPDYKDVTLYLEASALGYGRQIGVLTRDRVLLHCLLAYVQNDEPRYLIGGRLDNRRQVDLLICSLNAKRVAYQPSADEAQVLAMAYSLLYGGGNDA